MKDTHEFLDCLTTAVLRSEGIRICAWCWRVGHEWIEKQEARRPA